MIRNNELDKRLRYKYVEESADTNEDNDLIW